MVHVCKSVRAHALNICALVGLLLSVGDAIAFGILITKLRILQQEQEQQQAEESQDSVGTTLLEPVLFGMACVFNQVAVFLHLAFVRKNTSAAVTTQHSPVYCAKLYSLQFIICFIGCTASAITIIMLLNSDVQHGSSSGLNLLFQINLCSLTVPFVIWVLSVLSAVRLAALREGHHVLTRIAASPSSQPYTQPNVHSKPRSNLEYLVPYSGGHISYSTSFAVSSMTRVEEEPSRVPRPVPAFVASSDSFAPTPLTPLTPVCDQGDMECHKFAQKAPAIIASLQDDMPYVVRDDERKHVDIRIYPIIGGMDTPEIPPAHDAV